MLFRASGEEDITIGTSVNGRSRSVVKDVMGAFDNFIPLRAFVTPELTFHEMMEGLHDIADEVFSHAEVPFERILEVIGEEEDSHSPLFQVLFNVHNDREEHSLQFGGVQIEKVPMKIVKEKNCGCDQYSHPFF